MPLRRSSGSISHRNCCSWQNVQPRFRPSAAVCKYGCCKALLSISCPPSRVVASTRWSSPGHFAASLMLRRLLSRRIVCFAAEGHFASSSTGDLPTPRWLGGRTVSPRYGGAAQGVSEDGWSLTIGGVQAHSFGHWLCTGAASDDVHV